MVGTSASHTAGNDLCTLAEISSQAGNILIINRAKLINAERADLFSAFSAAGARTSAISVVSVRPLVSHKNTNLLILIID
jgi:hypothetical protein